MNKFAEIQNDIADTEAVADKHEAGLADLRAQVKQLDARRPDLLKRMKRAHDDAERNELSREVRALDDQIREAAAKAADVEGHVASLRAHATRQRAFLSEAAVVERRKSAVQAGERVNERLEKDLPAWVAAFEAWAEQGEQLFKTQDAIATANRRDLHHAARIASENAVVEDAASRELLPFGAAIDLRIDSVLARFLHKIGIERRIADVAVPRPFGAEIPLGEIIDLHADRLAELVRRLTARIQHEEQP